MKRCPRKLVSRRSLELLELYGHYKNGHLPVTGALLDQPAFYLQAMNTIDHLVNKTHERPKR